MCLRLAECVTDKAQAEVFLYSKQIESVTHVCEKNERPGMRRRDAGCGGGGLAAFRWRRLLSGTTIKLQQLRTCINIQYIPS